MRKSIGVGGLALVSAAFLLSACGTPGYRYSYYDRPYYYSSAYAYDDCMSSYGREVWFDGRWVRT
jgi:hypothetical protein